VVDAAQGAHSRWCCGRIAFEFPIRKGSPATSFPIEPGLPGAQTLSGSLEGVCCFDSRNCQTLGVPRQSRGFTLIKLLNQSALRWNPLVTFEIGIWFIEFWQRLIVSKYTSIAF
jgi:hypothetical protein